MPDVLWSVLVPVKRLPVAKTRLALPEAARADLALAMACDVVRAALDCPAVTDVVVISDDSRARAAVLALGASVLDDEPDAGLNPALSHGFRTVRAAAPGAGVAVVSSDVPGATPAELTVVLSAASGHERAFLADLSGTGTTVLTAGAGAELEPHYGPGSAAAHEACGHRRLAVSAPGLSCDVDTVEDLVAVLSQADRRAAPHTRAVADRLGIHPAPTAGG